jgi:hypothetical protein
MEQGSGDRGCHSEFGGLAPLASRTFLSPAQGPPSQRGFFYAAQADPTLAPPRRPMAGPARPRLLALLEQLRESLVGKLLKVAAKVTHHGLDRTLLIGRPRCDPQPCEQDAPSNGSKQSNQSALVRLA